MDASQTKDHDKIKEWVEARQGEPAVIRVGTHTDKPNSGGLLRIRFDDDAEDLQQISWDEFFKIFAENGLTFLYDPDRKSRFNKFIYDE